MPRALLAVVHIAAVIVFVLAIAIIVDMEPGSSSQGGRYYVAVAAIFTLLALFAYGSRLVEWDAPFVFGTSDQEQRYAGISLVLLALASMVLLGLAWALP